MYGMIDVLEEFGIKVPKAKDARTAKKTKSGKKGSKSEKADPKESELGTKKGSKTLPARKGTEPEDVGELTKISKNGGTGADATAPPKSGKRNRRLRIHSVLA